MTPFVYTAPAARVVFGSGTKAALAGDRRSAPDTAGVEALRHAGSAAPVLPQPRPE